jgi:hypothetical protein
MSFGAVLSVRDIAKSSRFLTSGVLGYEQRFTLHALAVG